MIRYNFSYFNNTITTTYPHISFFPDHCPNYEYVSAVSDCDIRIVTSMTCLENIFERGTSSESKILFKNRYFYNYNLLCWYIL